VSKYEIFRILKASFGQGHSISKAEIFELKIPDFSSKLAILIKNTLVPKT